MSINDVARLAGVSSSTVSRVINNHPRVAPETADAVKKAMRELGYTPSDRRPGPKPSLRTRTGAATIAFLVFGTSRNRATPAFEQLLHGVSLGASNYDLNLVFAHVPNSEDLPSRILDEKVDGLLLHGALPPAALRERLKRIPTVWLMGNRRRPEWGDQVMPDGYEIGDLAAKYLVGRGHQHLAFFDLDANHWPFRVYGHAFATSGAEQGATVHMIEHARQPTNDYWQAHSPEAVDVLVQRYLKLSPRPTGIFVADDMQVAIIQPALQRAGVEIGRGRVDVVSCNNERPYLIGLSPTPGVIDIRAESIGRRGVEQLVWRLEHPGVVERITTTVEPFVVDPTPNRAVSEAQPATGELAIR
jgi:DNA-binding LacI/PurR family transcriptional regulator